MGAESTAVLAHGLADAQWNVTDLWIASVGIGGSFNRAEVEHITTGATDATALQHDILAAALNGHFTDRGEDHPVRYWRDLPPALCP
jgi:hypothetical protein